MHNYAFISRCYFLLIDIFVHNVMCVVYAEDYMTRSQDATK